MSGTSNVYYVPFQMVSATSANMADSITGTVDTQESNCWAIQASWIGTPTGTLKIQTSNDNVAVGPDNNPGVNVINWTDISGSSQSLTGSPGTYIWREGPIADRWVQVVWTYSSGSGTLLVNYSGKG